MDGRRRRWIALDCMFFGSDLSDDLLDRFGPAGVVVWLAFLCACKRNRVPGQITVISEEDCLAQLGLNGLELVNSTGDKWSLEMLWRRLGHLKQTSRRRRGRRTDIIATRWEVWQKATGGSQTGRSAPGNTSEMATDGEESESVATPDLDLDQDRDQTPPTPPQAEGRTTKPNPNCAYCEGTGMEPVTGQGRDGYSQCQCTRSPNREPRGLKAV